MIGYNYKYSALDGRYVNDSMHLRLTVTMTVPTDLADGCPFTIIDDGSHQRLPIKFMMCSYAILFLMKLFNGIDYRTRTMGISDDLIKSIQGRSLWGGKVTRLMPWH